MSKRDRMTTLLGVINNAITQLQHVDEPRKEAEYLLMHVLGLTRAQLKACETDILAAAMQLQFEILVKRRQQGEPIAYIVGHREFWTLDLHITPQVLIPRPETELLIELTLELMSIFPQRRVADLGCGSGAIACALASEKPQWEIVATDISHAALAIASVNARQHQLKNIEFCQGSWCEALALPRFNVIISNPPYICEHDPHLSQGDLRYEPHGALVSGKEGLDAIRCIAMQAQEWLEPGGLLLLEHGFDQSVDIRKILQALRYININSHKDLAGHERVTVGAIRER